MWDPPGPTHTNQIVNRWRALVERDADNARRILKKVEMIFGRPMKLSEIQEDQVDLYELVVLDMRDMM